MAISSGQVTVGTTRVQIDGTSTSPFQLTLHNSGTNSIYLGNSSVTKDDGFNLHTNSTLTISLPPLTTLFAVSASGSHELSWMRVE
jgi:hypothetical protein